MKEITRRDIWIANRLLACIITGIIAVFILVYLIGFFIIIKLSHLPEYFEFVVEIIVVLAVVFMLWQLCKLSRNISDEIQKEYPELGDEPDEPSGGKDQ